MKAPSVKPVRCAIYTRVSTEHGLDQEFNSLDAQYDAASAYIKSQAHAGWTLIRSRYDDGVTPVGPLTGPICKGYWTIKQTCHWREAMSAYDLALQLPICFEVRALSGSLVKVNALARVKVNNKG
jgi:hypothetical protein